MNKSYGVILFIMAAMFAACEAAAEKTEVFVSILPQKYFVQQIGKNLVDVRVMVQPGASPATYEPKPRQMMAIAETNVYFSIGVPFENVWLPKMASSNPNMKVVPTDRGIQKRAMTNHRHGQEAYSRRTGGQQEAQQQDDEKHPDSGPLDPHIWLSPPLVLIQAHTILTALQEIDPVHRAVYEVNYNEFISEILALNAELTSIFSDRHGLKFMVFHPAWGYFADTYGLKQIPVEIEGKSPKPAQLEELIKQAKKSNINVIFVQPQFSAKSAEVIAKGIDGQVVTADPLAEDWIANLHNVALKFAAALR